MKTTIATKKDMNRSPIALALIILVFNLTCITPAKADSWSNTGAMNISRTDHTATLLPNGKVLVAGGFWNGVGLLSSSELYDPTSGTWTATGSLNTGRYRHKATLLLDGRVLVVGGDGNNDAPISAELYDPETGTWTTTGSLNTGRSNHTATLLPNGKVLVAGGSYSTYLSSVELYDPATGSWTASGSMYSGRENHTATLLPNGKVLAAEGYPNVTYPELYDFETGTWTQSGNLNSSSRYSASASLLPNGKVIVAGGISYGNFSSATELYDPATGAWTTVGALNTARSSHTTTLLRNGKVIAVGGASGVTLSSAELYDPATGTWTASVPLSSGRYSHTATLLPNGKVLVAGGSNASGTLSSAELFNANLHIAAQPQSQVSYWGKTVILSITVQGGNPPYTYQWLKNGVEIDGATSFQLELTSLQAENAGSYTVSVMDADNTTLISQAANLTVNPAGVSIATYAGLTIEGVIGQTYGIQATTDLGGSGSWAGVANVTLTLPSQIWYDSQSTAQQPKRFYRVVAGPISIP